MKKDKQNTIHNIVYSTNKEVSFDIDTEQKATLPPNQQDLRIMISKKGRGGEIATVVANFIGSEEDLEILGKELKVKCGVGGSVKDGEIILQGDKRDKALEYLLSKGYKAKKAGG
ncbi:MAG: translation initiation factor [Bacteroidetes bacterium]|nr:translation initiation factor [Bacteroidota bacterium]